MKRLLPYLFLLTSLLFMGCPYGAEVSIDEGKTKIDDKLIGKWESKSSTDYDYIVSKLDDTTYRIEKKSKTEGEPTIYMGFISVIDDTRFLNIWEDANSTRTYYFYKMDLTGSGAKLTLSPVTENIKETFTSSNDLKAFFAKNKNLSFFYDKEDEVYIRAD